MTTSKSVDSWLFGRLGRHMRGQTLTELLAAMPTDELPTSNGVCFLFASEFQELDDTFRKRCLEWCSRPGRTMVIMPPMKLEVCKMPLPWRPLAAGAVDATKAKGLAKLLAPELKYEMTTDLQPAKLVDGEWNRGGVNTAYFKQHPDSGVFAVTCLPIWSLTALDHGNLISEWIGSLHSLAGEPIAEDMEVGDEPVFKPSNDHFALLLHLNSGSWKSRDSALRALEKSVVLTLPTQRAAECMAELEDNQLAADGEITSGGKEVLGASPYMAYASTLEKSRCVKK